MTGQIAFTPEKLEELRKAYKQAVEDGEDEFTFDGHLFYIEYAKYMIEYLTQRFKRELQ